MGKRRKLAKPREADDEDSTAAEPVPITADGQMPQKRTHLTANLPPVLHVVVDYSPRCPDEAPWSTLFPGVESPVVRHVDIGCGFGGLTVSLAKVFPDKCVLAMEIRDKWLYPAQRMYVFSKTPSRIWLPTNVVAIEVQAKTQTLQYTYSHCHR
eukprot:9602-Heterococcus_DN1.PRE.2